MADLSWSSCEPLISGGHIESTGPSSCSPVARNALCPGGRAAMGIRSKDPSSHHNEGLTARRRENTSGRSSHSHAANSPLRDHPANTDRAVVNGEPGPHARQDLVHDSRQHPWSAAEAMRQWHPSDHLGGWLPHRRREVPEPGPAEISIRRRGGVPRPVPPRGRHRAPPGACLCCRVRRGRLGDRVGPRARRHPPSRLKALRAYAAGAGARPRRHDDRLL